MQENEGLLVNHNEEGVDQFTVKREIRTERVRAITKDSQVQASFSNHYLRKLGQDEQLHPQSRASTAVGGPGVQAHVVTEREVRQVVEQVRRRT